MAGSHGASSNHPINRRVMKFCEKSEAKEVQLQELMNHAEYSRFRELINLFIIELTHQREMLKFFMEIIDDLHDHAFASRTTHGGDVGETSGTRNLEKSVHDLSIMFKEMLNLEEDNSERTEEFAKKMKNLMEGSDESSMGQHCMEDNELWENWKDFQEMKTIALVQEIEFSSYLVDKIGPLMSAHNVELVQKFGVLREKFMSWVKNAWISAARTCLHNSLKDLNCIESHVLRYISTSTKGTFLEVNCFRKIFADLADMLI